MRNDREAARQGDAAGPAPSAGRTSEERVILVDPEDRPVGTAGKLAAHREGLLHRAFSVFVLDAAGRMLLQRRAAGKYHSGGLWSNACCSHPRPGEAVEAAAHRRLREEMGFDCPLEFAFPLIYRAAVAPELEEHEYDHVFLGRWDGTPRPDPDEVGEWRWVDPEQLARDVGETPESFTVWFRQALAELHRMDAGVFPAPAGVATGSPPRTGSRDRRRGRA